MNIYQFKIDYQLGNLYEVTKINNINQLDLPTKYILVKNGVCFLSELITINIAFDFGKSPDPLDDGFRLKNILNQHIRDSTIEEILK